VKKGKVIEKRMIIAEDDEFVVSVFWREIGSLKMVKMEDKKNGSNFL
jgi:hypothetical protein